MLRKFKQKELWEILAKMKVMPALALTTKEAETLKTIFYKELVAQRPTDSPSISKPINNAVKIFDKFIKSISKPEIERSYTDLQNILTGLQIAIEALRHTPDIYSQKQVSQKRDLFTTSYTNQQKATSYGARQTTSSHLSNPWVAASVNFRHKIETNEIPLNADKTVIEMIEQFTDEMLNRANCTDTVTNYLSGIKTYLQQEFKDREPTKQERATLEALYQFTEMAYAGKSTDAELSKFANSKKIDSIIVPTDKLEASTARLSLSGISI